MEERPAPNAVPFSDPSNLSAVRREQEAFGERAARPVRKRAVRTERDGFVFYEPAVRTLPGVLMYLHGGGYVSGDGEYADWVAGLLAVKLGIRVYPAAYGLAPERPYPAAVDDAERAYRALLARETPERIALYGDSSGGGLCFALLLRLKQAAVPLPAAVAASSPWTDLTLRALPPEGDDGLLSVPVLREWAALYAAGAPLDAPELSPVYGELFGLPPALLLAGGGELVRSDSERLHSALLAAGVSSELCVAPGMWHTYPLSGVRESRRAMEQTAAFLAARLSPGPSA